MTSAAWEMSVATTDACANSRASATARHPQPVPASAIASARPRSPPKRSSAVSTISSVSGRGIRTAGDTSNDRSQNSCRPVM